VGDYISTQQGIISGDPDARAAIFGASARLIWDLASWDNSSMLLNLGQSGNPFSPHYRDQLPLWQTGEVQKLPFSWELVRKTSIRTVNFSQKLYSKK
jgi:acyl-homoserine lactone acylase PvdQ